mmetsp:Transcript_53806/g.61645  ORF Transcript_53806/g.61645 Transcript_53806/m.61645 type:complete len:89 (+) Transcript_53806:82-348(+)
MEEHHQKKDQDLRNKNELVEPRKVTNNEETIKQLTEDLNLKELSIQDVFEETRGNEKGETTFELSQPKGDLERGKGETEMSIGFRDEE